ncbi:MAG: transcriptional regulator BetI [Kordiimonadaceae bacterium]|jgi:TetR/AcrR family transcriptional regulator, transcriptional repressor of bet genes|nr:transcriptional regulator BetI [Kordiimonadaceae bacterium]MBT6037146.1 transcriptional regulator BetI [Kordiimonadaceae bacterium]MBT6329923.1 transcriptional regulator BetI [Kordiimonadaceae bacterium]MBT7583567.1 transcriptional regulator BetI [Kordiimonadaceae bacterium]
MTAIAKPQARRRAAKVVRRRQLIDAAIESIAKRGLGDTTLAHVSQAAGLSQGIVNLHFASKENLLNETLKHLRAEYEQNWRAALEKAPDDDLASQLSALLRSDYMSTVANKKKLSVWFAFWGEAKSRPTYKKISQERMTDYTEILETLLERLINEGGYSEINTPSMTQGITAMADGLWLNILISASGFKRSDAEKVMMQYLRATFPKHKDAFY